MDQDINRLLMRFEQLLKAENRAAINPEIENLSLSNLQPMVTLVARCRAHYLKTLYELSQKYNNTNDFPTDEEMELLGKLRKRFIDLSDGSKSFEICIQRGYVDIE